MAPDEQDFWVQRSGHRNTTSEVRDHEERGTGLGRSPWATWGPVHP